MRRFHRGFSLPEVLISGGLLLVMLGISSMVCVSYFRVYRQYTDKSVRLRLEAKSLEALANQLRSASAVYRPDLQQRQSGFLVSDTALEFIDLRGQRSQLHQLGSQVTLVTDGATRLTIPNVDRLRLRETGAGRELRLELSLKKSDLNNVLDTSISWRPNP